MTHRLNGEISNASFNLCFLFANRMIEPVVLNNIKVYANLNFSEFTIIKMSFPLAKDEI